MGAGGACVCVCVAGGGGARAPRRHTHVPLTLPPPFLSSPPFASAPLRPRLAPAPPASFPPAALDLLEGLLTLNPEKRLTAEAALRMPFFTNPGAIPGDE